MCSLAQLLQVTPRRRVIGQPYGDCQAASKLRHIQYYELLGLLTALTAESLFSTAIPHMYRYYAPGIFTSINNPRQTARFLKKK